MEGFARESTLARFAARGRQSTFVRDVDERSVKRVWSRMRGSVQAVSVVLSWGLQRSKPFHGQLHLSCFF